MGEESGGGSRLYGVVPVPATVAGAPAPARVPAAGAPVSAMVSPVAGAPVSALVPVNG